MADDLTRKPGQDSIGLHSFVQLGRDLSSGTDHGDVFGTILAEARKLTHAEAGRLYVQDGGSLDQVVEQNDGDVATASESGLLAADREAAAETPAGYAAAARHTVNVPDVQAIPDKEPYRFGEEEQLAGYRTVSVLAIPLLAAGSGVVGVLELINRLGAGGKAEPFGEGGGDELASFVAIAAVVVHNAVLQDQLKQANLDGVVRLSLAAEFREDPAAADHVRRMSHTCGLIAAAMDLPPSQVDLIRFAAPMHDLGKIGIPGSILYKPGRLVPEERTIIEKHPGIGAQILKDPWNELLVMSLEVALTHHEKWDGKGYPNGLSGEEIPVPGRIAALADVFDALISARCYKEPTPVPKVLEIIRSESGKHFDPKVVDAFFRVVDDVLECYESLTIDLQQVQAESDGPAVRD